MFSTSFKCAPGQPGAPYRSSAVGKGLGKQATRAAASYNALPGSMPGAQFFHGLIPISLR